MTSTTTPAPTVSASGPIGATGLDLSRVSAALAVLRAALGTVFIAHGAQKIFVYGFAGVAGGFGQMGVPLADVVAPLVALLELFGGIALLAGLFTRPAAALLGLEMLGAAAFVHLKNGFFLPEGVEFVMVLFAGLLALVLAGPGRYALDPRLAERRARD